MSDPGMTTRSHSRTSQRLIGPNIRLTLRYQPVSELRHGNAVAYLFDICRTVYFDDLTVQRSDQQRQFGARYGCSEGFELANNYPNPFNPTTNIQFAVPRQGNISLAVYNVLGQHVRTLANGVYSTGHYMVTWDGKDEAGQTVASGIYFAPSRNRVNRPR